MDYYKYVGCYKDYNNISQKHALKLVEGRDYNVNSCSEKAIAANSNIYSLQYSKDQNTMQCFIGDESKDLNRQLSEAKKYGLIDTPLEDIKDDNFNFANFSNQCGKLKNGHIYGGINANALYATDLAIDLCNSGVDVGVLKSPSYYKDNLSELNKRFNTIINSMKTTYLNYLLAPSDSNTRLYLVDTQKLKKLNLDYNSMLVEIQNNIKNVKKNISNKDSNIKNIKTEKNKLEIKLEDLYNSDNAAIGVLNDNKENLHISIAENIFLTIIMISAFYIYTKVNKSSFNSVKNDVNNIKSKTENVIKNTIQNTIQKSIKNITD